MDCTLTLIFSSAAWSRELDSPFAFKSRRLRNVTVVPHDSTGSYLIKFDPVRVTTSPENGIASYVAFAGTAARPADDRKYLYDVSLQCRIDHRVYRNDPDARSVALLSDWYVAYSMLEHPDPVTTYSLDACRRFITFEAAPGNRRGLSPGEYISGFVLEGRVVRTDPGAWMFVRWKQFLDVCALIIQSLWRESRLRRHRKHKEESAAARARRRAARKDNNKNKPRPPSPPPSVAAKSVCSAISVPHDALVREYVANVSGLPKDEARCRLKRVMLECHPDKAAAAGKTEKERRALLKRFHAVTQALRQCS